MFLWSLIFILQLAFSGMEVITLTVVELLYRYQIEYLSTVVNVMYIRQQTNKANLSPEHTLYTDLNANWHQSMCFKHLLLFFAIPAYFKLLDLPSALTGCSKWIALSTR